MESQAAPGPKLSRPADVICVAVLIAAAIFVYRGAFSGFFVQDDFGWLAESRFRSFGEYIRCFFRFSPALGYRPLSQETFFLVGQALFGMRPLGFHLMSFGFYLPGVILVYLLLRYFFTPLPCLVGALFFAVHNAHFRSVYWISAVAEPMALLFYVLALILFIRFDRTGRRHLYTLSLIAALLGLMCKESILTLPVVLALYCLLFSRRRVACAGPFFALPILYFCLRLAGAAGPSPYPLTFGKAAVANLAAYLSWSAGFSEALLKMNLGWRPTESYPWIAAGFGFIAAALFWSAGNRRISLFSLLWFLVALQPVLYFSQHIYPYYLAPALPAISLLIAAALSGAMRFSGAAAIAATIACFSIWTAEASVRAEGRWWNERTYIARNILEQMPEVDRQVPPGGIAFLFGFGEEEFGAMMQDAAFKAFGYPPARFILVGLDSATPLQIESFKAADALKGYYCFRYERRSFTNMTREFRADPISFLPPPPKLPPPEYVRRPEVTLEPNAAEFQAGKDTMVLRVMNLDASAIDLLYTLNGREMPIVARWRLDENHSAAVEVGEFTPKGLYHFTGIRDSAEKNARLWIAIDLRIVVR